MYIIIIPVAVRYTVELIRHAWPGISENRVINDYVSACDRRIDKTGFGTWGLLVEHSRIDKDTPDNKHDYIIVPG